MEGSELRLLRQRLGLTQATLARSVGVATNTLARWERGELPISSSVSEQLIEIALEGSSGSAIAGRQGVIPDPHHKAILEGLQNRLDPEVFESCAVDLMMRVGFPVAPVSGGKDDGFDGAVCRRQWRSFPRWLSQRGDHFIRNLSQSLNRVVQRGWGSRKAIFATPRRITPGMRGKLSSEAKEIGFSLVQIFDQDWFANRLYDSPDWCNRLLSVTGRPRALKCVPKDNEASSWKHRFRERKRRPMAHESSARLSASRCSRVWEDVPIAITCSPRTCVVFGRPRSHSDRQ